MKPSAAPATPSDRSLREIFTDRPPLKKKSPRKRRDIAWLRLTLQPLAARFCGWRTECRAVGSDSAPNGRVRLASLCGADQREDGALGIDRLHDPRPARDLLRPHRHL